MIKTVPMASPSEPTFSGQKSVSPGLFGLSSLPTQVASDPARVHGELGLLLLQQQRHGQALAELSAAIGIAPNNPIWLSARAIVHEQVGEIQEALLDASRAVELDAKNPSLAELMGRLLERVFRYDLASLCYADAIKLDPNNQGYFEMLARALARNGDTDAAIEVLTNLDQANPQTDHYAIALADVQIFASRPLDAVATAQRTVDRGVRTALLYRCLGNAQFLAGNWAEAAAAFRTSLEIDPSDQYIRHMLAVASHERPDRASDQYVRSVFDAYAEYYEAALLTNLQFRVPSLLVNELLRLRPALKPANGVAHKLNAILDLGCGTGLSGALLHEHCVRLKGIDLSPNMVAKARAKGIYGELEVGEIVEQMRVDPRKYDLIQASDVLVYFGKLETLFQAVHDSLEPSGLFLFSVETRDGLEEYELSETARYRHAQAYVEQVATAVGLKVVRITAEVIRKNEGADVAGLICALERPLS